MPGKCFIDGTTCPDSRPVANASDIAAVTLELNDQVRPCLYMNDAVEAGTSATGAKSMLIPSPRRAVAVLAPCDRAVDVLFIAPICGTVSVGGAHGIRLMAPPSWSTAMMNFGWPPATAAARSLPVSEIRAVL